MKKISTALIYSVLMANTLSVKANATNHTYSNYPIPQFKEHSFEGKGFLKDKNAWSKIKRKLASEMSFSNSDLSDSKICEGRTKVILLLFIEILLKIKIISSSVW